MNRNFFIDLLKIAMSLAVVGIHVNLMMDINPTIGNYLVNGIFRIAVPVFFLINGYFFYDAIQKNKHKIWLKKILILYLLGSLFYSGFWIQLVTESIADGSYIFAAKVISVYVFLGYYHLWYFPAVMGAALITTACYKKIPEKIILALCIILYVMAVYMNYYLANNDIIESSNLELFIYRNFLFFAFPFFYAGYHINKHQLHKKVTPEKLYIVAFVSTATLLIEVYNHLDLFFKNINIDCYLSLPTLCTSLLLIALKTNVQSKSKTFNKYATGIYLLHIYIIEKLYMTSITNSITLTFLTIILSTLLCYTFISIIKKPPFDQISQSKR